MNELSDVQNLRAVDCGNLLKGILTSSEDRFMGPSVLRSYKKVALPNQI